MTTTSDDPAPRLGTLDLLRAFWRDRGGVDFDRELAARAIDSLDRPLAGERVLDLGCGPGHYGRRLGARGATVVSTDIAVTELARGDALPPRSFVGDARDLPFRSGSFAGVFCSNMLEHTPEPMRALDEIARVTQAGGWVYLSWTNWYSPWGGHAIAPFHYLGAERGLRVHRRVRGEPRGANLPFDGVWPVHIGSVLRHLRADGTWHLDRVEPRYYPQLRLVMRVPGLREVFAWNCVIRMTRTRG